MTSIGNCGFGASITYQSGFFAEITNIDVDGYEVEDIELSNNSITDGHKIFIPAALIDPGEITVEMNFDPDETIPLRQVDAIVLTFPKPTTGGTTGATMTCTGYMKSFTIGIPMDDRMTGTGVLKLSGQPIWSAHQA